MTYQQEMLSRAMSHIDDKMIESAHGPRKKARRVIPVVIAACLIAALWVSFPYLREVIDTNSDLLAPEDGSVGGEHADGKPESSPVHEMSTPATVVGTTLTLVDVTETTATFEMEKTDSTPVYAMLYDLSRNALASTEPNYTVDGVLIRPNTIKVYVDGADTPVSQLPSAAGRYRITLDFTTVRNGSYPMLDYVGVYAYVGEEMEETTTQLFSLIVPEESDTTEETTAP